MTTRRSLDSCLCSPILYKYLYTSMADEKEIRIGDASGAYRVMYIAKFEEAIYVLHCFRKKTQATSRQDKTIAETRYRAVAKMRKAEE